MYSATDVIWVLVAAILVFFMQAGFALCEAGLTRAKNTGNILMKNMMDFCIGTPCYWLVGFGLMFAGAGPLIGGFDPLIRGSYDFGTLPTWCYAIFQTVFCATAATIVSGSMAEFTDTEKIEHNVNSQIVTTHTKVKKAQAGNYAGMIGAALLALNQKVGK